MTLTIDQTSAISFYQENISYVEGFGLSNLDREDRILFRKGKQLIEFALQASTKTERIPFTLEEILPAWNEYLESYSDEGQLKVYDRYVACKGMDNRKDPVASAMGLHGQIVFYDNSNDSIVKSFDRAGKTLKSLMKEYNEQAGFDRFNV